MNLIVAYFWTTLHIYLWTKKVNQSVVYIV